MCKLRKLMVFVRSWTQCRRPEFIWLRKSERERWKMCVKFINDELEVAVRLSAEEESGCRQFAQRLDEDLASTLGNTAQHSSFLIFTLNVFFFSASSLDTSRCWWMWIQTSFTAQFHVFYCSSKLKVEIYIIVRRELLAQESDGSGRGKKTFSSSHEF